MKPWAYYNENDDEKVVALKALMAEGFIAPGEIDSRDIRDVAPIELSGFAQCHFFAGIGLWSVAARAAGIPDDTRFWSGSCPCQPFSAAGAGEGIADPRHLWPHWFWLIAQQRPRAVVGEQVASKDGLAWIELVSADMEGTVYAGGGIDLCSAGFGAPNIRQRLYMCWVDNLIGDGRREGGARDRRGDERVEPDTDGTARRMAYDPQAGFQGQRVAQERKGRKLAGRPQPARHSKARRMDNADGSGQPGSRPLGHASNPAPSRDRQVDRAVDDGRAGGLAAGELGDADRPGQENGQLQRGGQLGGIGGNQRCRPESHSGRGGDIVPHSLPAPTNGFWADADWLVCRDNDGPKLRPVRRGTFCLAAGYPGRTGELRAYGDAINLQVATAFLETVKPELMAAQ